MLSDLRSDGRVCVWCYHHRDRDCGGDRVDARCLLLLIFLIVDSKAQQVCIKLNIASNKEGTAECVSYMVSFGAIRVAHENCSTRVWAELGLEFAWDVCPAAQAECSKMGEIWLFSIGHLEGSNARWVRCGLCAIPQIHGCEDSLSPEIGREFCSLQHCKRVPL